MEFRERTDEQWAFLTTPASSQGPDREAPG